MTSSVWLIVFIWAFEPYFAVFRTFLQPKQFQLRGRGRAIECHPNKHPPAARMMIRLSALLGKVFTFCKLSGDSHGKLTGSSKVQINLFVKF